MIGNRLGIWTLEVEIGRGAMGAVYRARGDDARLAAVKVLSPDLSEDELFVGRFRREIEALRQLDHPHIVAYFDSGSVEGVSYLAMEFVDGVNYEQRFQARGPLPWSEVLVLADKSRTR